MNVPLCHIEADAMTASKGKILIPEANILTAKFVSISIVGQLSPFCVINLLDGYRDEFCRHCI